MHHREELERVLIRAVVVAAIAIVAAAPAGADWIVGTNGDRIETRGAWSIQGRLVVFELADGKLVSMPLSDVDLEASADATRAAQMPPSRPTTEPPPPPPEAVMVITDDDVAHIDPGQYAGTLDPNPDADGATDETATPEPVSPQAVDRLEVESWDYTIDPDIDGALITGRLANTSREVAAEIELAVRFLDHEENLLSTVPANLTSTTLEPGQTARFRVEAEGIYHFTSARFDVSSLGLKTGGDDPPEPPDGDD